MAAEYPCFAQSHTFVVGTRKVTLRFARVDGRLACVGFEFGPKLVDDTTFIGVTDEDLRPLSAEEIRFPLRRLVELGLGDLLMIRSGLSLEEPEDVQAWVDDLAVVNAARDEPKQRTGRPPLYDLAHFEEVARVYREHLQAGGRKPTKAVEEHFGVSKSVAAKWVARARAKHVLEAAGEPSDGGNAE